jgi:hypothetical protein
MAAAGMLPVSLSVLRRPGAASASFDERTPSGMSARPPATSGMSAFRATSGMSAFRATSGMSARCRSAARRGPHGGADDQLSLQVLPRRGARTGHRMGAVARPPLVCKVAGSSARARSSPELEDDHPRRAGPALTGLAQWMG